MPNQPRKGTSIRTLRMDDDLWAALKAEAEANGESVGAVVRRALDEYLKRG
jgi:predicted HicB family RNase H-like nuclease